MASSISAATTIGQYKPQLLFEDVRELLNDYGWCRRIGYIPLLWLDGDIQDFKMRTSS